MPVTAKQINPKTWLDEMRGKGFKEGLPSEQDLAGRKYYAKNESYDPTLPITGEYQTMGQAEENARQHAALHNMREKAQQYASSLSERANKFKNHELPTLKTNARNVAKDRSLYGLANTLQGVKRNANARGLLNSGLHEEGNQFAQAQNSSDLANEYQAINERSNRLGNLYEEPMKAATKQAELADQALQGFRQGHAISQYQAALEDQQRQNDFYSNLLSGAAQAGALSLLLL